MSIFKFINKKNINPKLGNDLLNQTKKEIDKIPPINILVVGKTGSGKSTLINALFRDKVATTGVGQPVTQEVQRLEKSGVPLVLYDTKGLELTASAQHQVLVDLSTLIQEKRQANDPIHVIYYCLNASIARIEEYELTLIKALSKEAPVILILTQSIGEQALEFKQYLQSLQLPVKDIVLTLAKPYLTFQKQKINAFGLQEIVDTTLDIIPSEQHRAFINAQQVDIQRKVTEARRWANSYIKTAFGIGFVPIPLADASLLVPMQLTMLAHITAIFGLSLDKAQVVSILAGIGGTGGVTLTGKLIVSSITKLIPGIGSVGGGLISGATASSLTIALAYSYIEVLHKILSLELTGRDMPLKQLQRFMQQSFTEQLRQATDSLPDQLIPNWISDWLD